MDRDGHCWSVAPHMDWDANNLPEAWCKFKLHADLMFSGSFKERMKSAATYSFGLETKAKTFTTLGCSWTMKERY